MIILKRINKIQISFLLLLLVSSLSCVHSIDKRNLAAVSGQNSVSFLTHRLKNYQMDAKDIKKYKLNSNAKEKLEAYFSFLGLENSEVSDKNTEIIKRILNSSIQFLYCPSLENWQCLEQKSEVQPTEIYRQEFGKNLGQRTQINRPFKMKYFIANQWDLKKDEKDMDKMMSEDLARVLNSQKWDRISMAIYGIDEIAGSMKKVYQAIEDLKAQGTQVRAVVDIGGLQSGVKGPIQFNQLGLTGPKGVLSIFSALDKGIVGDFQYEGTPDFIRMLNKNVKKESEAIARIEFPPVSKIMHNKFLVFEKGSQALVWTGTTNVSDTCMGIEDNANMSILIDDSDLAQVYLTEFNEMFEFKKKYKDSDKFTSSDGHGIPAGLFHQDKRPNTKRYFSFSDGTEVRIHFSPTDDGEHRVLIPMLLSARKGDIIRISMFGSGGLELVRAIQYAAAQGAQIKIVLDRITSANTGSWVNDVRPLTINQDEVVHLLQENPYEQGSNIEIRTSTWKGMNHHKTATLTRKLKNGNMSAEIFIIGSQNWSLSGNDENDENMISIRNLERDIPAALAFNEHFDERLWVKSVDKKSSDSH